MDLGVNVDHVATLRNLRGTSYPSVLEIARVAMERGADFITVHLREDRRHICDEDVLELKRNLKAPLNLEMAATNEMLDIAKVVCPHCVCLVPEKREEVTTESGIDVRGQFDRLQPIVEELRSCGIGVTLFIEPDEEHVYHAKRLCVDKVELHVGAYCRNRTEDGLTKVVTAARAACAWGMECHAGHGIEYGSAAELAKVQHITALNVGHFLICESVFRGIGDAVQHMKETITRAREHPQC